MKKLLICILTVFVCVGAVGFISNALKKDDGNKAAKTEFEQIVELPTDGEALTENQIKSLNCGAMVKYNDEIYNLSQFGDEMVYVHSDNNNIFVRKYVGVNIYDGSFRSWDKVNDEYVTKALLSSALTDYVTDSSLNSSLSDYVNDDKLLSSLADYVAKNQLNGLCKRKRLTVGETLNMLPGNVYIVQCFDSSDNLADFKLADGSKKDKTGRFAITFYSMVGGSLTVIQTGSIVLSNLVATSSNTTSIQPADNSCYINYYELSGMVA